LISVVVDAVVVVFVGSTLPGSVVIEVGAVIAAVCDVGVISTIPSS
jgi:hypothetical protein